VTAGLCGLLMASAFGIDGTGACGEAVSAAFTTRAWPSLRDSITSRIYPGTTSWLTYVALRAAEALLVQYFLLDQPRDHTPQLTGSRLSPTDSR